jgi:hypothetical protein
LSLTSFSRLYQNTAGIITFTFDANGTITGQSPVIIDPTLTSNSWWFLFAARQLTTLALAVASEFIVIDIICLHFRWINFFRSPLLTLLFVQSRGWPFLVTSWAIYDLVMLQGDSPFVDHWMFYQNFLRVFNASNPRQETIMEWAKSANFGLCGDCPLT